MMRLSTLVNRWRRSPYGFGLAASLLLALYYGGMAAGYALSSPYIVQDDARQHVVWMVRFQDPNLFPGDWIADYYQSLAPEGFRSVFWAMAHLGIDPLLLAKVLPLVLGIITTIYFFHVFLMIFPAPGGAFLSTLILHQLLWVDDDLASATPRAFVYPIFSAFLYYLLRRSPIPTLITIALQGLFFPQLVLIQVGILTLRLVHWKNGRLHRSPDRYDYQLWLAGVGVALLVLLPFALSASSFGDSISATQMRSMPEFGRQGRNEYFGVSPIVFWLEGRSGIKIPFFPSVGLLGFALPWLRRSRFPALRLLQSNSRILLDLMLASLVWFVLAHGLLLRLYLPSRYTYHSWRFALPLAAAIAITALVDTAWPTVSAKFRGDKPLSGRDRLTMGAIGTLIAIVTFVPLLPPLPLVFQSWRGTTSPTIYEFFASQPKSTLVASLADGADYIPAFSRRSTLVGREFAIPYHPRYYQQIQQRARDVIRLQYSPDPTVVSAVIRQYGIDWIWVDQEAFQPQYLKDKDWLMHTSFQATTLEAIQLLEQGKMAAITRAIAPCGVVQTPTATVLEAQCVERLLSPSKQ